jgi:hypothetical protein
MTPNPTFPQGGRSEEKKQYLIQMIQSLSFSPLGETGKGVFFIPGIKGVFFYSFGAIPITGISSGMPGTGPKTYVFGPR